MEALHISLRAKLIMIRIDFTGCNTAIKLINGKENIFCIIRRKWLLITPEEWVRQNLLCYMVQVLKYPASLIAVEKQISLGELKKRYDIVVYKSNHPFLVIECKEMNVKLTEAVLSQVLRYNISLNADHFLISNGVSTFGYLKSKEGFHELHEFPLYSDK